MGAFEAAALVNRDIHEHGASLHARYELVGDELGGLGAGDQHGTDHEVGLDDGTVDFVGVRSNGLQTSRVLGVEFAQAVDVDVEDGDVSAHADGHSSGVGARDAGTDHGHLGGAHPGYAAHQDAGATTGAGHRRGADLNSEASGDLAHRGEQGQRPVGLLHCFVGDGGHAELQQSVGEFGLGGEVQVGEEDQALTKIGVLGGDRLFHLEDHVGARPHLEGGRDDGGAGGLIVGVSEAGGDSGAGLYEHGVVVKLGFVHSGGGDGHAEFVVLYFGWNTNDHGELLLLIDAADRPWSA